MKIAIIYLSCLIGCVCGFSLPAFSKMVNPQDIEASRDFYYSHYVGFEGAAMNWTGDHDSCDAGTISQAIKDAMLLGLNYFRVMAGVHEVTFYNEYNRKAQQAALMMSVNGQLSHTPTTSWKCYTEDGAEAAGTSNLGCCYPADSNLIYLLFKDQGPNNYYAGHRRIMLYPQTQLMGFGAVSADSPYQAASAIWNRDSHFRDPRPITREKYVAWPPPGYVPYQVVFPRWSFAYDDADFQNATVTMTREGNFIPATMENYLVRPLYENGIVWRPFDMPDDGIWPSEHLVTYTVTVSNVIVAGSYKSFTYTVKVFDPVKPESSVPAVNSLLLGR